MLKMLFSKFATLSPLMTSDKELCVDHGGAGHTDTTVMILSFQFVPVTVLHAIDNKFNALLYPVERGACYCFAMAAITVWLNLNLPSSICLHSVFFIILKAFPNQLVWTESGQ